MAKAPNKKLIISLMAIIVVLLTIATIINCSSCSSGCTCASSHKKDDNADSTVAPDAPETILARAKVMAAQYDYESAILEAQKIDNYDSNEEISSLITQWQTDSTELVEYPCEEITHVFVHSLIYDASRAFDGDAKQDGYNLVMTTVDEFNKMMDEMYNRGFVLVSMHDICTFDEQGNRVDHSIYLPQGKKAFVLSQDDTCYYHSQIGDGMADKIIIDDNGEIKCHYVDKDGKELIGDYDMVPIIDTFVKEHPDFSYHGHKGVLALTGYNGLLGYRTDTVYKTRAEDELDYDQAQFLEENPDFDFEKECSDCKKVCDLMKETGWEFASHTWGHRNCSNTDLADLQSDTEKYKERMEPIIGKTDMLIFANGGDFAGTEEYDENNEKFMYFISQGFHIFCPVDSTMYWQQKGPNYFRMSRRNLDGYRMYHNPELLEDLFEVKKVFDPLRPTPVPDMSVFG